VGLIASYLYPSFYTRSDTNTWKLEGTIGQYIELAVIDLDIEIEDNIDSFIEIFDISLEGAKSSLGRLYRKGIGSIHYKSSWHMMDIELRVGINLSGRGFFGRYKIIDVVSNMNQYVSSGKFRKLGNVLYIVLSCLLISRYLHQIWCRKMDISKMQSTPLFSSNRLKLCTFY
jgi:hypothetical protein